MACASRLRSRYCVSGSWEFAGVYLDESLPGGGGEGRPWCRACKETITEGQKLVRLHFPHDPKGVKELTGPYHVGCSKPFDSLAHALAMLSRFGR